MKTESSDNFRSISDTVFLKLERSHKTRGDQFVFDYIWLKKKRVYRSICANASFYKAGKNHDCESFRVMKGAANAMRKK